MNNYLPVTVPGTSRMRAVSANLQNQYGFPPAITWNQEEQILMADGSFKFVPCNPMFTAVTDESLQEVFPLVNPDTGEIIGEMAGADLLNAVQSYYIFKAKQRDLQQAMASQPSDVPGA